jgi:hypothetical protein
MDLLAQTARRLGIWPSARASNTAIIGPDGEVLAGPLTGVQPRQHRGLPGRPSHLAARVIRPLCLAGFEARRRCSAGLARLLPVIGACDRQPDQVLVRIDTAQPGGERFGRNAAVDERAIGLIEHPA